MNAAALYSSSCFEEAAPSVQSRSQRIVGSWSSALIFTTVD